MTVAPNRAPERISQVTQPRRRSVRKAVSLLVFSLAVALAVVLAVLWVLSAQELRDTRAQVVDLTGQVEGLEQQATDAQELTSRPRDRICWLENQHLTSVSRTLATASVSRTTAMLTWRVRSKLSRPLRMRQAHRQSRRAH